MPDCRLARCFHKHYLVEFSWLPSLHLEMTKAGLETCVMQLAAAYPPSSKQSSVSDLAVQPCSLLAALPPPGPGRLLLVSCFSLPLSVMGFSFPTVDFDVCEL